MIAAADTSRTACWAACAWIALASPAMRAALESSMTLHMLAQIPLLAAVGLLLGRAALRADVHGGTARLFRRAQTFNAGGATGLIAAGFVMVLWMLPRCLDLARFDAAADAVKFISVPAAAFAAALSWPRLPAIARAVVHLEVIATFARFGWGYLAAEERLCLAYLADDQQRAGTLLLLIGAVYAIAVTWRPVFGGAPRPRLA